MSERTEPWVIRKNGREFVCSSCGYGHQYCTRCGSRLLPTPPESGRAEDGAGFEALDRDTCSVCVPVGLLSLCLALITEADKHVPGSDAWAEDVSLAFAQLREHLKDAVVRNFAGNQTPVPAGAVGEGHDALIEQCARIADAEAEEYQRQINEYNQQSDFGGDASIRAHAKESEARNIAGLIRLLAAAPQPQAPPITEALREALLAAIPSNWLDPLLTGPNNVLPTSETFSGKDIEALLNAIRVRVAAALAADKR